ncbi:hypothetical protein CLOM_g17819 [Closterium sp. NIES-68]|nr:hypothetical protein CLOM_g17819 [Closterium sp. NIES-68]GJP85031.1 hypothetical protein CLOP_g15067 [Closterium sp. NIES-67]
MCLIGGARHFELTAASLKRHVLSAYPGAHAFLIASLDGDAKKLALLAAHPSVVSVSVSRQARINETHFPTHVLAVPSVQLHQFFKIEQCAAAITSFERKHGFKYVWILWTRLDTYWTAPPPPLHSLNPTAYVVPCGSPWGGLNDRFGMACRDIALGALKRLSSLQQLAQANLSRLNGEKALQHQLRLQGITATPSPLPFCVLSFRRKLFNGYVFAPLRSASAAVGVSCRPCHPMPAPVRASRKEQATGNRTMGHICRDGCAAKCMTGNPIRTSDGRCNPWRGYEPGWQQIFLKGASDEERDTLEYASQLIRKRCEEEWERWRKTALVWDCPSARDICGAASACTKGICKML